MSASLLLCFAGPGARAASRTETPASVTIVRAAAVTVIDNTSLQIALQTAAIAPAGVVFTAADADPVAVGAADGRTGLLAQGGCSAGGLVALGGSLTGTTIDGDAVSVSVGSLSGGSAADSGRVPVLIAQYN